MVHAGPRQSWARLLQRVFEVDPLLCPTCGERMKIVGFVTQPVVVDKILRHRRERQLASPFESRAPPAAYACRLSYGAERVGEQGEFTHDTSPYCCVRAPQ